MARLRIRRMAAIAAVALVGVVVTGTPAVADTEVEHTFPSGYWRVWLPGAAASGSVAVSQEGLASDEHAYAWTQYSATTPFAVRGLCWAPTSDLNAVTCLDENPVLDDPGPPVTGSDGTVTYTWPQYVAAGQFGVTVTLALKNAFAQWTYDFVDLGGLPDTRFTLEGRADALSDAPEVSVSGASGWQVLDQDNPEEPVVGHYFRTGGATPTWSSAFDDDDRIETTYSFTGIAGPFRTTYGVVAGDYDPCSVALATTNVTEAVEAALAGLDAGAGFGVELATAHDGTCATVADVHVDPQSQVTVDQRIVLADAVLDGEWLDENDDPLTFAEVFRADPRSQEYSSGWTGYVSGLPAGISASLLIVDGHLVVRLTGTAPAGDARYPVTVHLHPFDFGRWWIMGVPQLETKATAIPATFDLVVGDPGDDSGGSGGSGSGSGKATLPVTGSDDPAPLVLLSTGLLAAGAVALIGRRLVRR